MDKQLLKDLDVALHDWLVTFCGLDCFSEQELLDSIQRLRDSGGTLAYIGELHRRILLEKLRG